MTDEEVKEMVSSLAVAQAKTDRLINNLAQKADQRHEVMAREADRRHEVMAREADRRSQEADRRQDKLDHQLQKLRDNIGGLANKFGRFTEALAYPSMEKLLTETFGMDFVAPDVTKRRDQQRMQVDVLAYANTRRNAVFVVEIKSRLKEEGIDQILKIVENFFDFFPEHLGKKLYAILAAVEVPDDLRTKVLEKGIYMAQISDDIFQLKVPEDWQPRSFSESIA